MTEAGDFSETSVRIFNTIHSRKQFLSLLIFETSNFHSFLYLLLFFITNEMLVKLVTDFVSS